MIRQARAALLAAAAVLALTPAASASDHLILGKGESRDLPLAGLAASVVVGDSAVADATVVSAHNVVVWGKTLGTSEVMAFDKNGRMLLDAVVVVAASGGGMGGHMTFYRGPAPAEYACAERCVALGSSGSSGGEAPSPGGSPGASGAGNGSGAPPMTFSASNLQMSIGH